jgi:putative transposase
VVQVGVTRSPEDAWVAQQLREATPSGEGPRFLICDNDNRYGLELGRVTADTGIRRLHTPVAAPKANAFCERLLGSVRRECLDQVIIFGGRHLRRLAREYVAFYNHAQPHQGMNQRIPAPVNVLEHSIRAGQRVEALPVWGGLHYDYRRVA